MSSNLDAAIRSCRYVALHVTDYCNLQCRYCFEAAPAMPKKSDPCQRFMELEVATRTVERIVSECSADHVDVLLFGGEPLLIGMDWLETAIEAFRASAKAHGKTLKIAMTTNATAVNTGVARRLRAAEVGVCVSIDGPPDIHDLSRGGAKSMLKGIAALKEAGIALNTICVVNPHNGEHIEEILLFLLDLGITKGRFTPMTYAGSASHGFEFDDINMPIRAVMQVLEHMLDTQGSGFVDLPLMRRVAHYAADRIGLSLNQQDYDCYTKTCWAGAGYLAVSGDGALYPCSRCVESEYQMGHLDGDGQASTLGQLERLHSVGMEAFHCNACPARAICFGGCAAHNKADVRNFELDCALTRALFAAFEENSDKVLALHHALYGRHNGVGDDLASDAEALHILDVLQKTKMTPMIAKHGGVILSNGMDNYLIDPANGDACAVTDDGVAELMKS